MKELCIRCGKPTPYDIHTPVTTRLYYIDGSGQLCEQCFSQLYPTAGSAPTTSLAPSDAPTPGEQREREDQEQIRTITLPTTTTPTQADQERYKELTSKDELTDADREELAMLYKKYIPKLE